MSESVKRGKSDRCPECGSDQIEGGTFEVCEDDFGSYVMQRCSCVCGAEWVDTYRMESSDVLTRNETHTEYTCPKCGNRDMFTLSHVEVVFDDVPISPDGWDYFDCVTSLCDAPSPETEMHCDECGYEAPISEFQSRE